MDKMNNGYQGLEEVGEFMAAFEAGAWPRSRWNHRAHLTVAFCYLFLLSEAAAVSRIRAGILHYNQCNGIRNTPESGYHETLTLFWIAVVKLFLRSARPGQSALGMINELVARLADKKDLWKEYYSLNLLKSAAARRGWIEPDRKPLPRFLSDALSPGEAARSQTKRNREK